MFFRMSCADKIAALRGASPPLLEVSDALDRLSELACRLAASPQTPIAQAEVDGIYDTLPPVLTEGSVFRVRDGVGQLCDLARDLEAIVDALEAHFAPKP